MPSFERCVKRYKGQRKPIEGVVQKVLRDPFHLSHRLRKRRKIDLRGKRSRHFSDSFVVVFSACDECIEKGDREKGWNDCWFCEGEALKRVIFWGVGKHDDVYRREYQA